VGGRAQLLTSLVLLAAACVACGTTTTASTPPSNAPDGIAASAAPDPTDCQARIEQATFDNLETIDRVAECRFTDAGVEAAAVVLAAGGTRDVLWSALWIYDVTGADPVRRYLTNEDESIRAMAAAILARLGERDALLVLGSLASDDGVLLGSHPPVAIGEFAIRSLARTIATADVPTSDVDHTTLGSAAEAWQAWLDSSVGQLRYDGETGEWSQ
jgi:hypothetical protein